MSNDYTFDPVTLQNEVYNFVLSVGIKPIREPKFIFDGKTHRFSVEGDKSGETTGWYVLHDDGLPAGTVGDWRQGINKDWKFDESKINKDDWSTYFSGDKYDKAIKKSQERKRELDEKVKQEQIKRSENVRIRFEALPLAKDTVITFKYLVTKNILPLGEIRYNENLNALGIPLRDIHGVFKTCQWIFEDGTKRFEVGLPKTGNFFSVGFDLLQNDKEHSLPILIGEGVATMLTVHYCSGVQYPCVAAMDCGNLESVSTALKEAFPKNKIIILADNDFRTEGNPGLTKANYVKEKLKLNGVIYPKFNRTQVGSDWNDFRAINGENLTKETLSREISLCLLPDYKRKIFEKVEMINARDLLHKTFSPMVWAIEGFLASGLSILAGGPKVGKSIFSLHISLCIALGGYAFGKIKVQQGRVLYLALEDTEQRLQERMEGSNIDFDEEGGIANLDYVTKIPRQHEGGLEFIRWWLEDHSDARLVIIDTLQKFRKQLTGKNSMYTEDYEVVSEIKQVADEFGVPFLIVHHLKKAMAEDWLNEISGSQGIAGAADTILSLKRARTENGGILHRTGRDVEEKDFALELDGFGWVLKGDATEFTTPEWKRNIINYLKEHNSVTPMQLSQDLELPINTAKSSLRRLEKEGALKKIGYGTYALTEHQI